MFTRSVAVAFASSLAACAVESPPEEVAAQRDCDDWVCGSNSPMVDNYGFHDLNVNGLRNASGFALVRVDRNGVTYRMAVQGGEIILTPISGGAVLSQYSVKGAILRVVHAASGQRYNIEIADAAKTVSWARLNGDTRSILTYQFRWQVDDPLSTNVRWTNVCTNPTSESEPGMNAYHTMVFEGDRIDARTKTVVRVEDGWFNFGCAGHALAKMHLTGHTEGARALGFETTLDQRTTMLKMLSADYCGTGQPFTVAGTPLTWRDDKRWMSFSPLLAPVEARWRPDGVACLNTPRLDANPSALGEQHFGTDVRAQVETACGRSIPTCGAMLASYHLVSGNP